MNRLFVGSLIVIAIAAPRQVQADDRTSLYEEILAADQTFFTAFNQCDIDTMGEIFAQDLEFFHDTGGLAGYERTMAVTLENCDRKLGLIRTLDLDSMSVYPVRDYGAIQEAEHTFCHMENGENVCGTFKFVHVWRNGNDRWQLTRVISYGHQEGGPETASELHFGD